MTEATKRFNWHRAPLTVLDDKPVGYGAPATGIAAAIGAEHLAGTLVELAPGQKLAPYHWEAGQEEWLLVLEGRPTVRTPDETRELRAGDLTCFPRGPAGAHQIFNAGASPVHLIMLSEHTDPQVIVYPDSGKVSLRTPGLSGHYRLDTDVDFWDREP